MVVVVLSSVVDRGYEQLSCQSKTMKLIFVVAPIIKQH
jgi:hypothetical protein